MSAIGLPQQRAIEDIVWPERARFDRRERRVYSHDTGVLPGPFQLHRRPEPGRRSRAARDRRPGDPVGALRTCRRHSDCATGQGDLRLRRSRTGSRWARRGPHALEGHRLGRLRGSDGLRSCGNGLARPGGSARGARSGAAPVPDKCAGSTVGGWLAQGGAGIGSHAYGWFSENVLARAWSPVPAQLREVSGARTSAIADAEGTTGIITEVTLAVRRAAEQEQTAVAFARRAVHDRRAAAGHRRRACRSGRSRS